MSKKNQQTKEKKTKKAEEQSKNNVEPQQNHNENNNSQNEQETQEDTEVKVEAEDLEKEETKSAEKTQEAEDPISELEKQVNEWRDKYLRLSAEFDNFRKRTLKEKTELTKTAGEDTLKDILPVMDDFERAMESLDNSQDVQALKDGVHLIYGKFRDFLNQKGVKEIEAKEKDFDTDLHDAITKVPAPTEELKGKIVDVVQKGYTLNDKVIRYAKVVIGE